LNSQSLDFAHKVLTGIDEAYWQWDLANDRIFYSAQLMKILGYNEEEQIGSSNLWEKYVDSQILEEVHEKVTQHLKGYIDRLDVTVPLFNNQGQKIWLHALGKVVERQDNRASMMFGTVKDVTDTKNLIVQLKKQNDSLMLAERISHSGHWRFDIKTKKLDWSAEVYRLHGLTNKTILPTIDDAIGFVQLKDRAQFKTIFDMAINQQQAFNIKTTLGTNSQKKIKVEIIAEIEWNNQGEAEAIFGVYKDITRSEDIFEKLKLLAMVNFTIKVPIFFIDDNDNVVYQDISPHYDGVSSVLFNYINFSITEYMEFKKEAKVKGQIKQNNISFDKYNSVFDLSVTYEAEEGIYIWIVENVTEKFRKEQQQIISNRLALLGNTFGNVSHDINNVLGVALGAIEMLEIKFSRGEDISDYIERVKNAIDKGKDVTERLLAFTRKPTIKVVSFDPIQDIYDNQYLFKQLLLSTINISFNFDPIHCLIKFPQGEFINILLNLVLNAQDAIQEKGLSGQIEISANVAEDNRLEIHVKDSGIGIAKENLTKIFDPFYSSKSVNKGNGIGLANVYSTMYKHNGLIQVEGNCELGGAHFTLVFKCEHLKEKYVADNTQINKLSYENTNILVLDDEVSIAEFVALFLESKGANVVVVANNKLELIEQLSTDIVFDIFITDMILPDLSGKEAVNMVTEKFPGIKVFSISGYIAIEDRSWDYPVLRKPFNSKELADFLAL